REMKSNLWSQRAILSKILFKLRQISWRKNMSENWFWCHLS
ncbi:uncharacterized protein METZ01_LOCUS290531, partial [marine metagenome]